MEQPSKAATIPAAPDPSIVDRELKGITPSADLTNEIADMIGMLDGSKAKDVAKIEKGGESEDPGSDYNPETDVAGDAKPKEKATEEPKPEEEPKKETEEEEKPEGTPKEEENTAVDELKAFRDELNAMASKTLGIQEPETKPAKPEMKEEPVKKEEPKPVVRTGEIKPLEVNEKEFDEAVTDHKGLNKLLSKINAQILDTVQEKTEGRITDLLRSIPQSVGEMVRIMIDLRFATKDFYERNKDLKDFRPFVSLIGNEIMAKNPDKPLEEIFIEVEKEVRKRMKLPRTEDGGNGKPSKPAFVNTKSSRKPAPPVLTGLRGEIADFIRH